MDRFNEIPSILKYMTGQDTCDFIYQSATNPQAWNMTISPVSPALLRQISQTLSPLICISSFDRILLWFQLNKSVWNIYLYEFRKININEYVELRLTWYDIMQGIQ